MNRGTDDDAGRGWPNPQEANREAGLTLLLFWGSSQSKESDERIEVKLDRLLEERGIDPLSLSDRVNRYV